ncbi:MAG TPA: TetR/AcrR family transcriptional regulator [Marmoricola sp.]|nr:TetR/AcrR family transcriptional regulator [Marmoricola sp.]
MTLTSKLTPKLTPKGAATRSRIVEAAADLMFVRGVAGTTLEHVRDEAGVSSSQVYHYFADKDALVRAVIDYQNDAVVGAQEDVFARLDSVAALRAWRDEVIAHQDRMNCMGGCPIGALGSQLGELDYDARRGVAQGFHRWQAAILHGFRSMQENGTLPATVDTESLATAMLASLQGGLLLCQLHRSTDPLRAAMDTMIDHVAYLAVSSPPTR